jgi:uncharacterized protein YoxC
MFITDTFIDTVSNGKKQFVNTVFANHKTVAEALNGFVDAQTAYTKSAVKAGTDTATKLSSEAVKLATEASKFDFAKATETFTKAFQVKK